MPHPCSICARPELAEINASLAAGTPIAQVCRTFALEASRRSLYRHFHARHGLAPIPKADHALAPKDGSPAAGTDTLKRANQLAKDARRHMRAALKAGDLKAANGAIQSATKALELFGRASGELQSGANVNVNVSVEAKTAMDLHEAAQRLSPRDVTREAHDWLAARLEAGDADAGAAVGELLRLLPDADGGSSPADRIGADLTPST